MSESGAAFISAMVVRSMISPFSTHTIIIQHPYVAAEWQYNFNLNTSFSNDTKLPLKNVKRESGFII